MDDKSDYWLASDAREVAEEYSKLPTPESKNMIRGALGLSPLNTNVKTAWRPCSVKWYGSSWRWNRPTHGVTTQSQAPTKVVDGGEP